VAFDAILFDFDGTLVDSEPLHYECWRLVLAPFGVSLSWEQYCQNCIGVSDRAMITQLASALNLPFEPLYAQYPRKQELLRQRLAAAPPMPSSVQLMLRQGLGLPVGLVTSSHRAEVAPVLDILALTPHFHAMVFGDEVSNLKPHPEPYQLAAARLNIRSALVFEDSPAGLASARAAGFTAVQVAHPEELPQLLANALKR
jgi:HAD superfamily hydrolase (TIGR01509 family)